MTIKTLAKLIAKHEGKKKIQVNIAQINEILGVLSDLVYEEPFYFPSIHSCLFENGKKRSKKKKTPFKEPFGEKLKPLKKTKKKK